MKANAYATVMMMALSCDVEGEGFLFSVRRVDGTSDDKFFKFGQAKTIESSEVAAFIPEWRDLDWSTIPDSMLSKSESFAIGSKYRFNVRATEGSGLNHDAARSAFLAFLAS
jgi:hypothetical protein